MLNVEFHCHTEASKDSLTKPEALIARCRQRKIDRLVVTDHNVIAGALRAKELAPDLIIVGEEIKTNCGGELLAAFVTELTPRGLSPLETIQRLRAQGAFISVSHPFDRSRSGAWQPGDLRQVVPLVDALEVFNARCLSLAENQDALQFARQHGLPGTVGSDAHALSEVGQATLLLPDFHDAASLKQVIAQGQMRGGLSPWWVHFYSMSARWIKRLKRLA